MAENDMGLIMFKVLAYLYECMVNGVAVKSDNFRVGNNFFCKGLNQAYLDDICMMLEDGGYTKGFKFASTWGNEVIALSYSAKVTPEGFEYLKENKAMRRVYNYMKEAKGWIPFF